MTQRVIPVYTVRVASVVNGVYIGERDEQRADCTRCGRSSCPSEIEGNGGLCCGCAVAEAEGQEEEDE